MKRPILCLDFDGVLHSYTSGWQGAHIVPDAPVPGAMFFLWDATKHFSVCVFSSRSNQDGGIQAMKDWLLNVAHSTVEGPWWDEDPHLGFLFQIEWPTEKPPAMVTIDDRAITFNGTWPSVSDLLSFQPWNRKEQAATKP